MILNVRSLGKPGTALPPGHLYIGDRCYRAGYRLARSKWFNPFPSPRDGTRDEVIEKYRAWIVQQPHLMAALHELRGKRLVCWCAPERCHAGVLTELVRLSFRVNATRCDKNGSSGAVFLRT